MNRPGSNRNGLRIAERMRDIAPFYVVELLTRARALEVEGRSIVHMEVGEPDFPTPQPMIEAAIEFIRKGDVHYTPALGIPALRSAIATFYMQRYGVDIDPERIAVTSGASAALLLALGVLVDPGTEVLLSDPGYPCNRHFVRAFEGEPRPIPVNAQTSYQPTEAQLDAAWTDRTRVVIVGSPANPTGTLLDAPELERIAELASRRGAILIADEIYHGLTYGCDATTALSVDSDVFVVNSFSKYFGMTGWRLGWLVVPPSCIREVEKLAQNLYIAPSAPAQYAALAAFDPTTIAILEERRAEFAARRDLLLPALRGIGFDIPLEPRGAFYLYAGVSALAEDAHVLAQRLLEEAGVAITPGLDFGENEPHQHVRFAYTTSRAQLESGIGRIERFLRAK